MEKAREFQKNIYFCFIDYAKAFDCVDHNKLWKILKEMGIPDHLICLLRNLYYRAPALGQPAGPGRWNRPTAMRALRSPVGQPRQQQGLVHLGPHGALPDQYHAGAAPMPVRYLAPEPPA